VIGWRVTDVVQLIRGPKGTTVRLLILTADAGINAIPKEITLVRDKVKLEEQAAKKEILDIKQDDINYRIGVINIPTFYSDFEAQQRGDKNYRSTTRDVKKIVEELKAEGIDGIIIDLRNNGGGYLQTAVEVASEFIGDGVILYEQYGDGTKDSFNAEGGGLATEIPMVVLVNEGSASASEIVAGAIQDHSRGKLVGVTTYGKGSVQNWVPLSDDQGAIRVTIAKWLTPNGQTIHKLGLTPDVIVERTESDYNNGIDPQFDAAVDLLLHP